MAGYIIRNSPMGTPRLMSAGTLGSKVPAAIDLRASMGGVRAKSEIDSTLPRAMPTIMLTSTNTGSSRKSSRRVSRRVIAALPGACRRGHGSGSAEHPTPR